MSAEENWAVGISSDNAIMCVDHTNPDGTVTEICEVWGEIDDKEVTPLSRKRAHLIAAAPQMYEALEGPIKMAFDHMVEFDGELDGEIFQGAYDALHAALKAARGGEQS